jgi:hypothetical protein
VYTIQAPNASVNTYFKKSAPESAKQISGNGWPTPLESVTKTDYFLLQNSIGYCSANH